MEPLQSVCLVVSTRHERANVAELVVRIERTLETLQVGWHIVFVDDSDDETPDLIRDLALTRPVGRIELIHRRPDERTGSTYGALMRGLGSSSADVVVVMDADMQHPAELLPWMLTPLVLGRADICVPSRFLPGGPRTELNGPCRRGASRAAGLILKAVFTETRRVDDPRGGFFAMRREVIDGVTFRPEGSNALAEILVRGHWTTHCEFPYRPEVHAGGKAHATLRDGWPFLHDVGRLWADTRLRDRRDRTPRRRVAPVNPILLTQDGAN